MSRPSQEEAATTFGVLYLRKPVKKAHWMEAINLNGTWHSRPGAASKMVPKSPSRTRAGTPGTLWAATGGAGSFNGRNSWNSFRSREPGSKLWSVVYCRICARTGQNRRFQAFPWGKELTWRLTTCVEYEKHCPDERFSVEIWWIQSRWETICVTIKKSQTMDTS